MTEQAPKNNKRTTWLVLLVILAAIIAAIVWYMSYSAKHPSTDDSYVQAHIINIAPQVNGQVSTVDVKNHQLVSKGQLLFTIDARPYQYAQQTAEAQLKLAQEKAKRIFPLIKTGRIAPSEGDEIKAQIKEATASLNQAQYNLNHTKVTAPQAGVVANFTVRVGDSVSQGIALFAVVEQQQFWVDANFKETQLQRIKPGQKATVKVDMYPGHKFTGVVQSISPGAGAIFSLLPPENATGNWVKVTQRVPVKVLITNPSKQYPLLAGTSAHVTVNTVA